MSRGKNPVLLGECNGCEACLIACPENAIARSKRLVGKTYRTERGKLTLFTGELIPGVEESSIVVKALKKKVFEEAGNYDAIIVDTSPGTHCNVTPCP
jgi:MinD superfamily P-loop ATPase